MGLTRGRPSDLPLWTVTARALASVAANTTLLTIEGLAKGVIIHRITIKQIGLSTAAALRRFYLVRTDAAATLGTDALANAVPAHIHLSTAIPATDIAIRSGIAVVISQYGSQFADSDLVSPAALGPWSPYDLWRSDEIVPPLIVSSQAGARAGGLGAAARAGLAVVDGTGAAGAASLSVEMLFTVA